MKTRTATQKMVSFILALFLAVGGFSATAYAAVGEASAPQANSVLKSGIFVIKDGRFSAAGNAALNSKEALALRARFDRFYANDLVGVYLAAHTAQVAFKPKDGIAPAIIAYNAAAKTATALKLTRTDANGFCYFAMPKGVSAPLSLIISNGKLVAKKKSNPQPQPQPLPQPPPPQEPESQAEETEDFSLAIGTQASEVWRLVNAERAKAGLSAVMWDSGFAACAQIRAAELTLKKGHERPYPVNDGIDWPPNPTGGGVYNAPSVADEQGIAHTWIMENAAYGGRTAEEAVAAWMGSAGHRANILKESHVRCGVGVYYNSNPPQGGCSIGWALWLDDYSPEETVSALTGGGRQSGGKAAYTLSDSSIEINAGETRQISVSGSGSSDFTVEWSVSALGGERLSVSEDGLVEALYPQNESITSATGTYSITAKVMASGRAVATLTCKVKYIFKK